MNYCQDGLQVYFGTETLQYYDEDIFGHYQLQTYDVNGRPWFKKADYGLWAVGTNWFIGPVSDIGQPFGVANNQKDVFCPHQLSDWDWRLSYGGTWVQAGPMLGITCEWFYI